MRKKKVKHEEHENHERWLVSYADFITLLFAFFTVLYATSLTDTVKLKAVTEGINAAFDGGMPQALLDVMNIRPEDTPVVPNHLTQEAAEPIIYTLKRNLAGSMSDHVVQLGLVDQKLTLVLPERFLFAPGSAELHPAAYSVLAPVAKVLKTAPATVEVVGYADGVPVAQGGRWEDNWALASARSLATVRYLTKKGVPVNRLIASASLAPGPDAEARAVAMNIVVDTPSPAADVERSLELSPRAQ